jgi:putative ABC transport system ATP-binding protein
MQPLAHLDSVTREFHLAQETISVLRGVSCTIRENDFIAVMGASGSGKSTLLHILGCLDSPSSGSYVLDGKEVSSFSDQELSQIRNTCIGFVFQDFFLLPQATVYENVMLPFLYADFATQVSKKRVLAALEDVGMSHRLNHKPAALSGGERQRVSIARAVAVQPRLILADEPTGNLDSHNSSDILKLFSRLHRRGATIVMVTHDTEVAGVAQETLFMQDGLLVNR